MMEELVIVDMGKGPSMNESFHSHRFRSYGFGQIIAWLIINLV
jgi:hypothetical protein